MKTLSIVIYSKNRLTSTISLVKSLLKNKKLNIEIIIVDQSTDNTIDFLYKQFFNEVCSEKIKILSYKKARPSKVRLAALEEVNAENIWFVFSPDKIKLRFLDTVVDVLLAIKPDITEFNVEYFKTGISKFKPQETNESKNKIHNIQKNPNLLATSSPFIYSKIFKTSFLKKNKEILTFDSYFDSLYNYILLSMAKTYYYIDIVGIIVKQQIIHHNSFNLLLTQWNLIINYFKEYTNWNITKKYIEYNFASYVQKTLLPLISDMDISSVDKFNKQKLVVSKLIKTFPNYKLNKHVMEDLEIMRSPLLKENSRIKSEDKWTKLNKQKNKKTWYLDEVDNEQK